VRFCQLPTGAKSERQLPRERFSPWPMMRQSLFDYAADDRDLDAAGVGTRVMNLETGEMEFSRRDYDNFN